MVTTVPTGPGTRHEKESLNDYVARIDPAEAPFYSNCGSKTVGAITHEWPLQELEPPNPNNFHVFGVNAEDSPSLLPQRFTNFISLSKKDGKIAATYDRIETSGGEMESNRQRILKALALRRDSEAILTRNGAKVGGDVQQLGGVQSYITNVNTGVGGAPPTGDGTDTADPGTPRILDTIAFVDDAMLQAYNEGGSPRGMYMEPGLKQSFSKIPDANAGGTASTNEIQQTTTEPLTFVGAVSAYLSDFGRLEVIPSRFMAGNVILGIDPDHIAKGFTAGGEMREKDIATVGDSERFMIINEMTLEVDAPKAHFAVLGLLPAPAV